MDYDNNKLDHTIDILIVEDSQTQADQLANLLQSHGYRVRVAENGLQGLAQARAEKPTLIISDISMPEMDGFEMCAQLKKDSALQDVPVILLTALSSLYDVIKGLDCGADNFIRKPYEHRYLLGRIRFILANRDLRSNDRVQLGMKINLGGQTHFVTAERQQIFDLLISTYEEAIQMTEELKAQQSQIAHSYQSLAGLYQVATMLNPAITEKEVAEKALECALELPGVLGGCVKLADGSGGFRNVASLDFGACEIGSSDAAGSCPCQRMLLEGTLRSALLIEDCPLFRQALQASPSVNGHVSIPLILGERSLGVMNLRTDHQALSMKDDAQVLDTVGNQIAVALERANLYANMESLVNERTEALQAERHLLSAVVNTSGALVLLVDPVGNIVIFNPACEKTLGWSATEVVGRAFWDIFLPPDQAESVRGFFRKADFTSLPPRLQAEWIARDGSQRKIIWSTAYLRRPDQTIEYFLGTGVDVTELRVAEEKVAYLSNYDSVTGLPNRFLLRDRMKHLQEKVVAHSENVLGLLVIHFPRLPLIRESFGVQMEQALLLKMATRLNAWTSTDDSVARYDDGSFALITLRREPKEFAIVARNVLSLLEQPFVIDGQEIHMETCIGMTIFPNDGYDFDTLCQCAEAAMRRALDGKRESYQFYTPELNRGSNERFKLESALRRAIERDQMLLHYQPQVDLKTGKIIGLEALIRWQHPELGLIPPGRFIGLAEETGLILPIGEWVLRKACEQNRAWQEAGLPALPVAVNLSAKQFSSKIPETVKAILSETGLDPNLLELELTESLSMEDPKNSIEILRILKGMGVKLSIDDFGTGYSNLNYLKRFPVDKLKLDQSFVRELTSDPDDLAISRAVIAMAHSLRLKVIAEGVETEGQLALLAQNGCDEIQGYFFSRPVDVETCTRMLYEQKTLALDKLVRDPYKRTLLFVDDEVNMGAAIKRMIRNKGYTLHVTKSAAEAFEILATTEVGVILCDQRMPGMSGTEFLSRVKQMYPPTVRVVLSGYTDLQSVTDAVNHGAIYKFMTKPWDENELLTAISDAFHEFETKSGLIHPYHRHEVDPGTSLKQRKPSSHEAS